MIKSNYLEKVKKIIAKQGLSKNWQAFLFGSSLVKERFGDLDLGITGEITNKEIADLKEVFQNSTLPYSVDVINFNKVSKEFKKNVFNQQIIWIKR